MSTKKQPKQSKLFHVKHISTTQTLTCTQCGAQAKYWKLKYEKGFLDIRVEGLKTSKLIIKFKCECGNRPWIPADLIRSNNETPNAS